MSRLGQPRDSEFPVTSGIPFKGSGMQDLACTFTQEPATLLPNSAFRDMMLKLALEKVLIPWKQEMLKIRIFPSGGLVVKHLPAHHCFKREHETNSL